MTAPTVPSDRVVDGAYRALPDPVSDRLLTVLMAVAGEVWTLRDRSRRLEAALQRHGVPLDALREEDRDSPEALTAMRTDRDAFVERVFGALAADR